MTVAEQNELRAKADRLLLATDLMDKPTVRQTLAGERDGDHEHCMFCWVKVFLGDEWWAIRPLNKVGLCFNCHEELIRISPELRSAGLSHDPEKPRRHPSHQFVPMTEAEWLASTKPHAMLSSLRDLEAARLIDRKLRLFASACVRCVWHLLGDERSRKMVDVAESYADGLATPEQLEAAEVDATAATSNIFVSAGLKMTYDPQSDNFQKDKLAAGIVFGEQPEARAWKAAGAAGFLARRKVGRPGTSEWYEGGAWIAAVCSSEAANEALADAVVLREREASEKAAEEALLAPLLATEPIAAAFEIRARDDAYASALNARRLYENPGQSDILRCLFGNPFRHFTIDPSWVTTDAVTMARSIDEDRSFGRLPELADCLEAAGCRDFALLTHCRDPGQHARGCWVVDAVLDKS